MDAKPATPLSTLLLLTLCVIVAAAGTVWQAWDMFGAKRQSMLQGWDDAFYYFWLPSVVIDHDLDFTNQLGQTDALGARAKREALTQPRTPTGLLPNKYPPGWAIGSLPFFLAAHAVAPANSTGFEPVYLLTVWCGQLLYAGLGLWLAAGILARFFPRDIAPPAVLAGWLASPLVYYQTARLYMSHSQVFVLAMAVFWLALRAGDGDGRNRHWALLGFCAALLVATRNIAVVYLVLPAFVAVRHLRSIKAVAALGLGAVLPAAAQLLAWKILYGSWLTYSYGGERLDFAHLHLGEVLFSARHGWFYWHPLMFIAIAAFIGSARRQAVGRAWLVSLAVIVLADAAWPTWWLGSSFGHRGFEVPTLFAMIGLAALLRSTATHPLLQRTLKAATLSAIVWNLVLFSLFLAQRIPREEAVTYGDVVRALGDWIGSSR